MDSSYFTILFMLTKMAHMITQTNFLMKGKKSALNETSIIIQTFSDSLDLITTKRRSTTKLPESTAFPSNNLELWVCFNCTFFWKLFQSLNFSSYVWECRRSRSSGAQFVKEFYQLSLAFLVWLEMWQQFLCLQGYSNLSYHNLHFRVKKYLLNYLQAKF